MRFVFDDVTLALKVAVTSISGSGFGGLPTFGNREISTVIRLRDGETNMLAGLIRDDERKALDGVPGLSDVPLVGHLFAHNTKTTQQTDIILTLTPHIVRVLDLSESDLRPFRLGRDAGASGLTRDTPAQSEDRDYRKGSVSKEPPRIFDELELSHLSRIVPYTERKSMP